MLITSYHTLMEQGFVELSLFLNFQMSYMEEVVNPEHNQPAVESMTTHSAQEDMYILGRKGFSIVSWCG